MASWLSALVHYLFLDDPRTQRVVAEPRADNAKMIGYMHDQCVSLREGIRTSRTSVRR